MSIALWQERSANKPSTNSNDMHEDPYFCLLHHAVIDDDRAVVEELSHDPLMRRVRNREGLTPLDLAHYLGNRECAHLLNPHNNRRTIRTWLRGDTLSTHLDEEQFARYFGVTYSSHLYFANYKILLKVLHNCPWTLRKTFLGADNRALAEKFQPYLESGRIADVSIRWIDDVLGYGLFANSDLPIGTFIGEFTGELRQLSRWRPQYNAYCFHYPTSCFSWNYMVIDAATRGNETRFINHSDTPNLQPHWLCNQSLLHLVFFTNQPVLAGMQLTYNYGQDFWRHRQKIAIQERQWVAELEAVAEKAHRSSLP